ncbi:MAG: hypothetical protein ACK40G_18470 [Cytophagaceae bacterium]
MRSKANQKGPNIKKRGAPTHDVIGTKTVNVENQEELNRLEDEYVKEADETMENVYVRHRNRNLDKPDINKPPY